MTHIVRKIRRRIFLGCQGDSERSYGTLLHRLVESDRRLHIDAVPLQPGAGDPLATVERAIRLIRQRERDYGSSYKMKAILLDRDQWGQCPARDRRVAPLSKEAGFHLVWQSPCHEGFLLHHVEGCERQSPRTPADAMRSLRRHWSDYEKGSSANYLATRITTECLRRACKVERDLHEFLGAIGYFSRA